MVSVNLHRVICLNRLVHQGFTIFKKYSKVMDPRTTYVAKLWNIGYFFTLSTKTVDNSVDKLKEMVEK